MNFAQQGVKAGAKFVPQYTKILREYSFEMRIWESWLETMLEAVGFYNTQDLNLKPLSISPYSYWCSICKKCPWKCINIIFGIYITKHFLIIYFVRIGVSETIWDFSKQGEASAIVHGKAKKQKLLRMPKVIKLIVYFFQEIYVKNQYCKPIWIVSIIGGPDTIKGAKNKAVDMDDKNREIRTKRREDSNTDDHPFNQNLTQSILPLQEKKK